jgi:peptide/nickel transport system permease protein
MTSSRQIRFGAALLGLVLLLAFLGPALARHDPRALVGPVYGEPAAGAPLGYDYLGHDVLSRVLAGGRSVVWMALATAAIALTVGTALGLVAGYGHRRVDQLLVWGADVFHAFPSLILVLLVVSVLGRDKWLIVVTASAALVPGVVRLVRGLTVGVASQEFVEAAEMLGVSRRSIRVREILPNIATPLLVHIGTMLAWAVGILSALSFLGYGVAPPAADWGLMINENRAGLQVQPWAVLIPAAVIAAFTLGANLVADGLGRAQARIGER